MIREFCRMSRNFFRKEKNAKNHFKSFKNLKRFSAESFRRNERLSVPASGRRRQRFVWRGWRWWYWRRTLASYVRGWRGWRVLHRRGQPAAHDASRYVVCNALRSGGCRSRTMKCSLKIVIKSWVSEGGAGESQGPPGFLKFQQKRLFS